MKKGPAYYPIFLNITGKRCAVVGGGQVALRKVKALLEAGATVTVISPEICPELETMAEEGEITVEQRPYQAGDLKGAKVVIAATDDHDTNIAVVKESRKIKALVNVVDDASDSDFIVPACIKRGDITVAISTSGRSPALARKIRAMLEKTLDDEYGDLALLINEVRTEKKNLGAKIDGEDWQKALDMDILLDLLKKGKKEQAKEVLLDNLKSSNG